jgi:dTDP-4-amino-4,6-dideoxy-D-galactose acyltransferase
MTMATAHPVDAALVAARSEALALYSPYLFLRELPIAVHQARFGTGAALRFSEEKQSEIVPMTGCAGQWLLQGLPWDSEYFGTPTYRLFTGLFGVDTPLQALQRAAAALCQQLAERGSYYAFTVVPAEDVQLLQALTGGGWQLVETRLNFYCPTDVVLPAPVGIRLARPDEAKHIGRISAMARNPYDRFHADPWFGEERADAFLARYAEAAVNGTYADAVLVPDELGLPVDAFLAIGDTAVLPDLPGSSASRILLTAVGPQNRGWHQKLAAETIRRAAKLGLDNVLMTTQATNRAVFRTCEKLGFRLGATTHVLACHGNAYS